MKITIVGGGLAGALSSCFLAKEFPDAEVEMIHSPNVPTLGVGESITPHLPGMLRGLGVDEKRFMRETGAVFKYGNNIEDWTDTADGPDVLRMFHWSNGIDKDFTWKNVTSTFPPETKTTDVWLDVYRNGSAPDLDVYHHNAEGYQYLKDKKMPFDDDGNYLIPATATYAYHIDAEKCAPWIIENVCKPYGVVETIAHVKKVNTGKEGIKSVILDDGTEVTSDIWLDCTGLSRFLISHLTTEFVQTKANVMNSAWVCPIRYEDKNSEFVNYTRSIRQDMGWQFKICLDARIGTGLIFSDEYFSDDEALEWLKNEIGDRNIRPPRLLKWKPGRLKTPNVGNTFAVGMAASFTDPLEANAVVSIIASIKRIAWMHQRNLDEDYYNRKMKHYFQDIADYTAVHYTLSNRGNNHFWKDMRRIGKELNHKQLVRQKYYDISNCMDSVIGYVSAFPDINWIDIANNWMDKDDLEDWPKKSTPEQQAAYIRRVRNEKLLHEIQSTNNKKSIDEFLKMYNNVEEYDKGLHKWPTDYFSKMFGSEYINRHKTNSIKRSTF
tara:strand:+ start:3054 stop:4706 length:1653 start_codon:yes stop_codon:yes gene_type:complete